MSEMTQEERRTFITHAIHRSIGRIPKEANITDSFVDWVCPCCDTFHRNETKLNYCSQCGQKIDWSDEE